MVKSINRKISVSLEEWFVRQSKNTGLPKTQVSHLLAAQLSQAPLRIDIKGRGKKRNTPSLRDLWEMNVEDVFK